MVPVAGSAYAYSYATLGEFVASFVGWNLVLEYLFACSTVAVGWSRYLVKLLEFFNVNFLPAALATSPLASDGTHITATGALFNLPAVLITALVTLICYVGIRQSAWVNNGVVAIKVTNRPIGHRLRLVLHQLPLLASLHSAQYRQVRRVRLVRDPACVWNHLLCVYRLDAVSTAAQEAKNPARDMPIGILGSLIICTILYVAMSAVLRGCCRTRNSTTPRPLPSRCRRTRPSTG